MIPSQISVTPWPARKTSKDWKSLKKFLTGNLIKSRSTLMSTMGIIIICFGGKNCVWLFGAGRVWFMINMRHLDLNMIRRLWELLKRSLWMKWRLLCISIILSTILLCLFAPKYLLRLVRRDIIIFHMLFMSFLVFGLYF